MNIHLCLAKTYPDCSHRYITVNACVFGVGVGGEQDYLRDTSSSPDGSRAVPIDNTLWAESVALRASS